MFGKLTRKQNVPRKTNGFGWMRKRGGAGAVACALAVTALLLVVTVGPTLSPAAPPENHMDEPRPYDSSFEDPNWEPPQKETPADEYNAGTPKRIPV